MNWNKSSEHLPPFYEKVLVVFKQNDAQLIGIGQRKQYPQTWDIEGHGTFLKDNIELWMELPEVDTK